MKQYSSFLLLFTLSITLSAQGTQLLRQPTISDELIVFVYANDLWKVERSGGTATRLTSNEGAESFPHFSPDGSTIAFTGQYDGNTDVYTVDVNGGDPQRLTYHPGADIVQGWTPGGDIIFRSGREGRPTQTNRLYQISPLGGMPLALTIPRAAYGEVSPDGEKIAYTPITSWDPEWRNYRGGQAMPIWIVDLNTHELVRTPQANQERHLDPVWQEDRVYFLSERDFASNIWSFEPNSEDLRQHTFHKDFDVKSLDATEDAIVYEQGGHLHLLPKGATESQRLHIDVLGDLNFSRLRWEDVPPSALSNATISPNGKRALFEYRGEIFSVPKKEGPWRNLSNNPGAADRYPIWSPKGDQIAWFSDESGEYKLVLVDQMGENEKVFDLENPTFYFQPDWSPDGSHIAYTDTDYNIWCIDLSSGKVTYVDTDRYAHPNRAMNPIWSPDSRYLAYARQLDSHFKSIFTFNVETGERIQISDGMADAISPIWDQTGEHLYFLASTDYGLQSGWLDMSSYDPENTRTLYMVLLDTSSKSPFLPTSDEEEIEEDAEAGTESDDEDDDKAEEKEEEHDDTKIEIITADLQKRIIATSVQSGNYVALERAPAGHVLVIKSGDGGTEAMKYSTKDDKAETYISGLRQLAASSNGEHLLWQNTAGWHINETSAGPSDESLKLNLRIHIDPQAEYRQIFKEAWRYMRDFLYVENVHGAPWEDVWEWYSPWVGHVRHRTDLNYVLDILSGEVSIGHSYVAGGDMPDLDRVGVGLLGVDFTFEGGGYKIAKIYSGESWNPSLTGPLAIPGLHVKEGEYLVGVNGQPIVQGDNIYRYFEETTGRQTRLHINDRPEMEGSREVVTTPIANESGLRRFDWIENNRRKVDELSNGKLAYVYVPNTSGAGFTYFNRYYFAQQDRKGVVIDERNNGGGSAADYMIDVMSRRLFGYFNSAAGDRRPWTTPIAGIWGPKVMIINERAGSGGDLLPYMFKEAKLGPLVGTRTWGGLVGTWDTPAFIDGGRFVAPRGGFFDVDGNWAVEGTGVAPDIEVIQNPADVVSGNDPQLKAAVEEALRLLKTQEVEHKPEPEAPVRYRRPGTN